MKKPTHAGAVCYLRDLDHVRYLIVSSSTGEHWVLPKGHIERGESAEAAAVRELQEEAGIEGEIVQPLKLRSFEKKGEKAVVQYYLIQASGESEAAESRVVKWVSASEGLNLLDFEEARRALREGSSVQLSE